MLRNIFLALIVVAGLASCGTTEAKTEEKAAKAVDIDALYEKLASYHEVRKHGRIYVIATEKSLKSVKETGHMPYTRTLIGEGPSGETVIIEVVKKQPAITERLWNEFERRNLGFHTVKKDNRIYVMGSEEAVKEFKKTGHMPYTKTKIGEGPAGETVVVEISKKDPKLADRLWKTFTKKHLFYAERIKHGRIYVIGSFKSLVAFDKTGHLPYTKTFIGEGPSGETVVFEIDKKNPHTVRRLKTSFCVRYKVNF